SPAGDARGVPRRQGADPQGWPSNLSFRNTLKGSMRKLAREAVIFCFLGALIAGVLGLVRERGRILREMGEPCDVVNDPNDAANGFLPAGPCIMDGKRIPQ